MYQEIVAHYLLWQPKTNICMHSLAFQNYYYNYKNNITNSNVAEQYHKHINVFNLCIREKKYEKQKNVSS